MPNGRPEIETEIPEVRQVGFVFPFKGEKGDPFEPPEWIKIRQQERASLEAVSMLDRWLLKSFAAHPEDAARYLREKGLEVFVMNPTGLKLQLAIRAPGETDYRVLDPDSVEAEDFSDLFFEILTGPIVWGGATIGLSAGAIAGAPAGPVGVALGGATGVVAGGAATGRAVEIFRQTVGLFRGINKEINQEKIDAATLSGGGIELGGRVIGAGFRGIRQAAKAITSKTGEAITELLSNFIKVDPKAMQVAVANRGISVKGAVDTAEQALEKMRIFLASLREELLPEVQAAQAILMQNARLGAPGTANAGQPVVAARKALRFIQDFIDETDRVGGGTDSALEVIVKAERIRDAIIRIATAGLPKGQQNFVNALAQDIPAAIAVALRRSYSREANFAKVSGETANFRVDAFFKGLTGAMKEATEEALPVGAVRNRFIELNSMASQKLDSKDLMEGLIKFNPVQGAEQKTGSSVPESFVAGAFGKNDSDRAKIVKAFDTLFADDIAAFNETPFSRSRLLASTLRQFKDEPPKIIPRGFTAVGLIPGALLGGFIGGGGAKLLGADPETVKKSAAVGAAFGIGAATPAGAVGTARLIDKGVRAFGKLAPKGGTLGGINAVPGTTERFLTDSLASAIAAPAVEKSSRPSGFSITVQDATEDSMQELQRIVDQINTLQDSGLDPERLAQEAQRLIQGAIESGLISAQQIQVQLDQPGPGEQPQAPPQTPQAAPGGTIGTQGEVQAPPRPQRQAPQPQPQQGQRLAPQAQPGAIGGATVVSNAEFSALQQALSASVFGGRPLTPDMRARLIQGYTERNLPLPPALTVGTGPTSNIRRR